MPQELVTSNTPFYAVRRSAESSRQESVEQFLYVLFRRKWLVVGLIVAFTVAAAIAMYTRPPVRTAVAKVLLKPDRMTLQISELASQSSRVPYSAELLKSELELINSRDVLLPVAQQLLAEQGVKEPIPPVVLDMKISGLAKNLVASNIGSTSVIEIRYFSTTSEEADRVLKLIVDQYLEQHNIAYNGSKQLLAFYEKQKSDAAATLEQAEEERRVWQEKNNIISIDGQISGLLGNFASQQQELQTSGASGEVALQENALVSKLEGDLIGARVELNDLLARYTEQDRRVREKRAQVSLLERNVASAKRAILGSVENRRKAVEKQAAESQATLQQLRERKLEGERLNRKVDVARDSYLLYGKKLEEARISHQLSREQLSNLAMIEKPHPTDATDVSERMGTVVLASIVGLTLGILGAFALAFFNKSLRTRQDVEVYLGVPVLATIPQLNAGAIPDLRRNA